MHHRNRLLLWAAAFSMLTSRGWAEVVIVVNQEVEVSAYDHDSLRDVFLGKRSLINGVQQADIVIQDSDTKQEQFLKRYVGITTAQFRTYWKKMIFTGKGKAPTTVADDQHVIEYIKSHRDAVGYIDDSSPHDGVKVLASPKE